jgi:hypothetical protein
MGESYIQLPPNSTGLKHRTRQRTVGANTVDEPYVILQQEEVAAFRGRGSSFRMPGRAGTTGQKIAALFNASGSAVLVRVGSIRVDLAMTVVKAITVAPPHVRVHKITAVPTNGTALPKVASDSALTSNASVTAWQDASADGTSSATALTVTIPASSMLAQEFAPRMIGTTYVAYEVADRMTFLDENDMMLRAGEGIAVNLDYVLATQNPVTDMWTVNMSWNEFTLP